jgi:Phospholipase A2-like domain
LKYGKKINNQINKLMEIEKYKPKNYSKYIKAPLAIGGSSEHHIPGYNFCGPKTQVKARLERGDWGINDLDNACRQHDVDYMRFSGNKEQLVMSDQLLIEAANNVKRDLERLSGRTKSESLLTTIGNWLAKKIGIGNVGKYILSGFDAQSDAGVLVAADIVANVFKGKRFLEIIGLLDPVEFAKSLDTGDVDVIRAEGEELFKKFF